MASLCDSPSFVESAQGQMVSAIETPVICELEQPHFSTALGRVELCRAAENFQEPGLHEVFGFTRVSQNAQGNIHHQAVVTVKEHRQGIGVPELEVQHERSVVQLRELRVPEEKASFRARSFGDPSDSLGDVYHTLPPGRENFAQENLRALRHILTCQRQLDFSSGPTVCES